MKKDELVRTLTLSAPSPCAEENIRELKDNQWLRKY
jgi:hypothetical protein